MEMGGNGWYAVTQSDGTAGQAVHMQFFCLVILAFSPSRLWRRTFSPFFPSAVRAVAARCKLPFALRPGLPREDIENQRNDKRNRWRTSA